MAKPIKPNDNGPVKPVAQPGLRIADLSHDILLAFIQSPNLERLTYGDPTRAGRCGDYASVGASLANAAWRIANDAAAAFDQLADARANPRLEVAEPTAIDEPGDLP